MRAGWRVGWPVGARMLYILTGPNTFNKRLRTRQLTAQAEQVVYVDAGEGVGRWFELIGQADLFGAMPAIIGQGQLDEWSTQDKEQWRQHITRGAGEATIIAWYHKSANEAVTELKDWREAGVTVEQFDHLSQARMVQWLKQEADNKGLTIENRYLASLAQWFDQDQLAAQQQLEMWSLSDLKKIGQDELLALGVVSDNSSVFDLTDSWARRQSSVAIKQFHELLRNSVDVKQIIGMLGWQIELMRASQLISESSNKVAPSSKAFNPSALQKASRLVKQWNEQQLLAAADQLIALDMASRNGEMRDAELGLELWLYRTGLR